MRSPFLQMRSLEPVFVQPRFGKLNLKIKSRRNGAGPASTEALFSWCLKCGARMHVICAWPQAAAEEPNNHERTRAGKVVLWQLRWHLAEKRRCGNLGSASAVQCVPNARDFPAKLSAFRQVGRPTLLEQKTVARSRADMSTSVFPQRSVSKGQQPSYLLDTSVVRKTLDLDVAMLAGSGANRPPRIASPSCSPPAP